MLFDPNKSIISGLLLHFLKDSLGKKNVYNIDKKLNTFLIKRRMLPRVTFMWDGHLYKLNK